MSTGGPVVDEPTDEADRARLHDALLESEGDVEAGRLVSAEDVLRELCRP
jgi:hypothetical protein